jgi:hypothetical protein
MRNTDGFVLIGDSSEDRFPAMSFHSYTQVGKKFYCLDLGGLTRSRGSSKGHKVYTSVSELPADRSDLAIVWVKPRSATRAVEVAHEAGCKRVWFSFGAGHHGAVERAKALEMEVVEIGRCPVYYMDRMIPVCRVHTVAVQLSGLYRQPPRTAASGRVREII